MALAGQLLAAGWLGDVVVGDGAADHRLGGVQVGSELGDAPALIQQGLQAAAEVGKAQAGGLLLEVALLAVGDGEAAAEDQAGRRMGCWGCFPCARSAGRPTPPGDPPS